MATWRRILRGVRLLYPSEQHAIASSIASHRDEEAVEDYVGKGKDEYELAGFFARYVAGSDTEGIVRRISESRKADFEAASLKRQAEVDASEAEARKAEAEARKAEAAAQKRKAEAEATEAEERARKAKAEATEAETRADQLRMIDIFSVQEFLPKEDNKYSLGRVGSTKVDRRQVSEILHMEGVHPSFRSFWQEKRMGVFAHIPQEVLKQVVCNEAENRVKLESYKLQSDFLCSLAEAIAKVRGVMVPIRPLGPPDSRVYEPGTAGYCRRPDARFEIGSRQNLVELKTLKTLEERMDRLIAEARGQIVVGGNMIFRQKVRVERMHVDFVSEVFGFVGSSLEMQVIRQIHHLRGKPKTWDGPLLALAAGPFGPGDEFVIDLSSDAVMWLAAALDAQVMAEAPTLRAASQVHKDVNWRKDNCLRIRGCDGYKIGEQYLRVSSTRAAVDESCINVIAIELLTEMALVVRVLWEGELWWLKMGPDEEERQRSLQAPVGDWERWFQTERDMLFRAQLSDKSAFPVVVEGFFNRPAMLVKDVGISLEKRLLSSKMAPMEVYEMSKQLYGLLESCGKQGVIHGDVCLQNICYKDGVYSLIDWGLACGRGFSELAAMVDKVWPCLGVMTETPGIPNWEMSPNVCFFGVRPHEVKHDLESLLYCCMKILNGNTLPWSDASVHGTEDEVLKIRNQTVPAFINGPCYVFESLIVKLRGDDQPAELKIEHPTKVPEANSSNVCYVPS